MNKVIQFLNLTQYWIKITFYDQDFDYTDCSGCSNFLADCTVTTSYVQNLGYYLGYRIVNDDTYTLDITLPPISIIPSWPGKPVLTQLQNNYFVAFNSR